MSKKQLIAGLIQNGKALLYLSLGSPTCQWKRRYDPLLCIHFERIWKREH